MKNQSPAFSLLLQSLRLDDPAAALRKAEGIIGCQIIDWNDLLDRAEEHSIGPQLESLLNKVTSPVPDFVKEKLNSDNRENLLRQLRSITEYFRIKKSLDEHHITAIPFKGFWMAHDMYGNLADRVSCDVDLFFDIKDFEKVFELMILNGYSPEISASTKLIKKLKKVSAEFNYEKFDVENKIFHFEYHWKIGSTAHSMEISYDDLASQVVTQYFQDQELRVFSPSAHLLLAVMHHGGKDSFVKLKHILDFGKILTKYKDIDWDWLITMAKRYDVEKLLYLGVKLASLLTGIDVPEPIRAEVNTPEICALAENRIKAMEKTQGYGVGTFFYSNQLLFQLRTRTRFRVKAQLVAMGIKLVINSRIVPKKVIGVYLKMRYGIVREA